MIARVSMAGALSAALLLAGCGGDAPAPAAQPKAAAPAAGGAAAQKKPAATPEATPVAPVAAYQYAYNPLGKRDPFRSPLEDIKNQAQGSQVEACSDPLCQWDLDQLILVAVVTGDANPIAMVEDPQGRGYIIKRNTKIGKQGGKVTQILRDSVTVTEFWTAPDGKVNPNPVSMRLKPDAATIPAMDLSNGKIYQ
ncbi:MAG TPA: pilus assembly protein PilP [Myxococcaceae bacterium]|nr:pilus assembly protein PilP [Myxococcaceae bacterium]